MPSFESIVRIVESTWWLGLVALGVSLVSTPIIRLLAYRAKIVDRPDDLLKPHGRPVAYLGGLAMCAGLLSGLACYVATMPDLGGRWQAIGAALAEGDVEALHANQLLKAITIAVACLIITISGLLDDLTNLTPRQKISGQIAAATVLLIGGVGAGLAKMPFYYLLNLDPPLWVLIPLRAVILLVLVICTCNATNLLDGLDGLCGGVTGIIALGYLGLAIWLASYGRFADTDQLRVGMCFAMVGAVLGFLPYNIPPASIFMGDAGSMLLGLFVGIMMGLFTKEVTPRWLVAACAVYALPILDTALAVVRRALAGKSVFSGDRSHLYDQLVDRGMTVKQVVVLFYVLAFGTAALGVLVAIFVRLRYALVLYAVLFVAAWVVFGRLGMLRPPGRTPSSKPPAGDAPNE